MPFTPLHMGPGLAVKSVAGRHFSLMVFGFSQVAIDLEPLVRIIRGDTVLHGFTHTYAGATLIGLVSLFLGRPVCQWLLDRWTPGLHSPFTHWLRGPEAIPWPAAISGAVIGAYSHILLDSIMHADMQPLAPLSSANPLLLIIPIDTLHLLCIASGALGALLLLVVFLVPFKSPSGAGPSHRSTGGRDGGRGP